jgi:hypothetical protein
MVRGICLPPVDSVLSNAFLSPLAGPALGDRALIALIELGLHDARQRGLGMVTLGFAANDARLEIVRCRFRCREYRTRLYRVRWPDMEAKIEELDGRIIGPEVSLL